MANIALLNRCNLKCPYCFAQSYTGTQSEDITKQGFLKLLDFCAADNKIGIIGGEPFLHKDINEFLEILSCDYRFSLVTVFTNGVFIDKSLPILSCPKFKLLINLNSREDIGDIAFERVRENIKNALSYMSRGQIDLGINVYKENQSFEDFLSVVSEFGFKRIRVSVVIPQDKSEGGIAYFKRIKPTLLGLYKSLSKLEVCPCYDCNAIPECVFDKAEIEFLSTLPFANEFERQIFLGKRSVCSPVIDLYPDMTATRCFGMDKLRVPIKDFASLGDLSSFFFKEIDCRVVNNLSCGECKDCYKFKTFSCYGGCLCYK